MLAIEERFKYVGTAEKYLDAAKAAMNFINTRKRTDEEGIYWTLADAAAGKPSYYDEICMYAGASGIICFLLSLYEDTQDAAYLDEAKEAGCYLEYRWRKRRELKRNFSPYAFSTGWGGASFALLQMYLVTKDEHYRALVEEILDQAVRDAIPVKEAEGYYWSTYPGIVGTAGTILVILNAAEKLGREDWKEFAVKAGRYFLTRGRDMGNGMICYTGVDPTCFGAGKDYIDPNFPMGTGGIGFLMLKLYEVSGKNFWMRSRACRSIWTRWQSRCVLENCFRMRSRIVRISFIWATATDRQEPTVSTMSCTNSAAMRNTAMRSRSLSKDLRRPVHRRNVRLDTGIRKISAAEPQVS